MHQPALFRMVDACGRRGCVNTPPWPPANIDQSARRCDEAVSPACGLEVCLIVKYSRRREPDNSGFVTRIGDSVFYRRADYCVSADADLREVGYPDGGVGARRACDDNLRARPCLLSLTPGGRPNAAGSDSSWSPWLAMMDVQSPIEHDP